MAGGYRYADQESEDGDHHHRLHDSPEDASRDLVLLTAAFLHVQLPSFGTLARRLVKSGKEHKGE